MDDKGSLLRHFLGALAYRTQKALRGAPAGFGGFRAAGAVRTPSEIVRHMTSVLGYARACYVGGKYRPDHLPSLDDEVSRFHGMLYHSAICQAARQRDWKVVLHPRGEELAMAAAALHASTHHVERFVNDLKQTLKAPWAAEHRDAFAAAIPTLSKQSRLRLPRID